MLSSLLVLDRQPAHQRPLAYNFSSLFGSHFSIRRTGDEKASSPPFAAGPAVGVRPRLRGPSGSQQRLHRKLEAERSEIPVPSGTGAEGRDLSDQLESLLREWT